MKAGYLGRALFTVGWLSSLGQQTAAANASLEVMVDNHYHAQSTNESSENLFFRVLADLRNEEKKRKADFESSMDLYRSLGFLVYDDLARLAAKFGIKLDLDGLTVFSMGETTKTDEIVVHYRRNTSDSYFDFRVVFYPNKTVLEEFDSDSFERTFKRLKIVQKNKIEVVEEEDPKLYDRHFAYITDMQKFDFQKVHRRLSELLYQRKKSDASGTRQLYVGNQVGRIANGLFKMYGGVPSDSFVSERDTLAGKGVISVFANQYFPFDIRCLFWLKIEGDQDAELSVQREANTRLGLPRKIGSRKIKPGDSIDTIISEILK